MKIAITGATGQLGELVIHNLLKQTKAENIIALVRDFDKAQSLKQQGAELRLFDYDQPETLIPALQGVDKLLLISANEIGRRT
ncbi:MAG: NAD(P)H-binding protein, partial [Acinetobacter sp.]